MNANSVNFIVETRNIPATSSIRLTHYSRRGELLDGSFVAGGNLECTSFRKLAPDILTGSFPQVVCDFVDTHGDVLFTVTNSNDLQDFFLSGYGSFLIECDNLDSYFRTDKIRKAVLYVTLQRKRYFD